MQIDGAKNLVITVAGNEDLYGLTRSAQMNIRPVLTDSSGNPAISYPAGYVPPATSSPTASGSSAASGASTAPTTIPAIGDTATATVPAIGDTATTTVPAIGDTATGTAVPGGSETVAPATGEPATSPAGLHGPGAALAAPNQAVQATDTPAAAATDAPTTAAPAAATDTAAPGSAPATGTAPAADGTGTAASTASTAPPAWPAGSDPNLPTQPLGTDPASWTAWEAAATTALPTLSCADLEPYRGLDDPNKPLIACSDTGDLIYLLDKTLIAGTQIDTASSGQSTQGAGWVVNMTFKSEGYSTWSSYTASHTGTLTAMTLDGQVISAPRISGPITTPGTEISGSFTQESAAGLANSLKFGALPLAFDRAESVNVSAAARAWSTSRPV